MDDMPLELAEIEEELSERRFRVRLASGESLTRYTHHSAYSIRIPPGTKVMIRRSKKYPDLCKIVERPH